MNYVLNLSSGNMIGLLTYTPLPEQKWCMEIIILCAAPMDILTENEVPILDAYLTLIAKWL